jgi:ubiquitin carboxyl-terminal hydrolase 8
MTSQVEEIKTIEHQLHSLNIDDEDKIEYGVSRYKNIDGVTCYMNSILHILQQSPIFIEYITQIKFKDNIMSKLNQISESDDIEKSLKNFIIFELFRLFKISHENDDAIIQPNKFKESVGKKNDMWSERRQQDSQEFLTFLISQLQEEAGVKCEFIYGQNFNPIVMLNSVDDTITQLCALSSSHKYQKREFSLLKPLFEGLTTNTKRCLYCSSKNTVYEPFVTLGLTIPENKDNLNIYDCLDMMICEDQFDANNKISCNFCGFKNRAFNKTQLWQLPKILIIHFKRFITNYNTGLSRKIINNVDYPVYDLDLNKYFDPNSPHINKSHYDLYAINIHKSLGNPRNINAGHYTSLVKNMINNNWHYYNDESSVKTVYEMDDLQEQNAYMLFYYRHD